MEITVQRTSYDEQCTQGEMRLNGAHFCYTLEPRRRQSDGKPYCIPAGRYRVVLGFSPHFQRVVPMLQDVPGFENIEIHVGNKPSDTHGCTLVAAEQGHDWQSKSAVTLAALVAKLQALPTGEDIWITYLDTPLAPACVDVNTGRTA